ncbi:hypothetical protein NH340_JMT03640 [Sarcoptes scabiei]|nr:hypothetical protein NH340_JMT03640 [Sarcoptes scabiei]
MNRNFSKSNSDQKLEIFELSKSLTNKFTNSDVNESDRCGIKPKISEQNSVTYCELPFISTNGNDFATSDLSLGSFHHPETDMILTSKKSIQNESVTISNKILNEKRKSSPPENCDTIGNISDGTSYPIYSSTVVPIRDALSHLTRLDDFNVVKLSQGFFSQVFKVTHLPTGKIMVLKMNKNPTNRGNALKEIELLNRLNHRNIVAFMGTVVHEGALHPLLEYINGGTLEQLVSKFFNRSETMSLKLEYRTNSPKVHHLKNVDQTFIKLMRDVCRGMSYLHSNGYFHRDLASKNIFIRKYLKNFRIDNKIMDKYDDDLLEAVIGDFGFSTIDPKPDQKLAIVGSPYWLAPECLQNKWYNHRSDIFSFGVICCELNWRISSDPDFLPRCDDYTIDFARLPYKFDTLLGRLATVACKYEPDERPSFRDLLKIIDQESNHSIDEQSNESEANLLDIYCRDDSPMKFPKAPFKRFNSLDDDNQSSRDSIDEDVCKLFQISIDKSND